jgi:hypothetical protein
MKSCPIEATHRQRLFNFKYPNARRWAPSCLMTVRTSDRRTAQRDVRDKAM